MRGGRIPCVLRAAVAKTQRLGACGLSNRAKRGHLTPVDGADAQPVRGFRASRSGLGGR